MKITAREKEILEMLKKEPLIAQDDLARRFGISRSSIAVHISNLMKKGFILGKGYVFNEQIFVAVLGELCLEVKVDQQQGSIDIARGGFAYRTSQALAKFGVQVKVLSLVGGDAAGAELMDDLKKMNIDIASVYHYSTKKTCRKLFMDGKLLLREDFTRQEYERATQGLKWVALNSRWLLIDRNFQFLLEQPDIQAGLFAYPHMCMAENIQYPEPIPAQYSRYFLVILGVDNPEHLYYYCGQGRDLLQQGLSHLILTDGMQEIIIMDSREQVGVPLIPGQVFDIQANLDLFLAGLIFGLSSGYQIRQAVRIATGIAGGS